MTNAFTSSLRNKLTLHDENYLHRERYIVTQRAGSMAQIANKSYLNFCSNDYLALSTHPSVKKAVAESAAWYGLGSAASPQVAGYSKDHYLLEMEFAEFLNQERTLLFNSGYHANLGVLMTLANKSTTIIADKHCHASIIDGALLSRATLRRFRHNDCEHAEYLLKNAATKNTLLITESVFSMHGDLAKLNELATLATRYNAMFMIDDAHGITVLGEGGRGASSYFSLSSQQITCVTAALGKGLGSMGAIVYGQHDVMEALQQFARTYCYSTALPAAICAGTRAAIRVLQSEPWRQTKLRELCHLFIKEASARNLPLLSNDITPIKSIFVGQNEKALQIQQQLMLKGLFVSCIRPPSVPAGSSLIRISLNCLHEEAHIIYLLDQLTEYYF